SIFGGSGTIRGTLLGLAAIVILENGLRLAALPAELAGISTGVLLVLTIALERFSARQKSPAARIERLVQRGGRAAGHYRDDAQVERRSLFHQLPHGSRGSRQGIERKPHLGRP